MARVAAPWPLNLSDALSLLNADVLRHLIDRLETPKPRPTRKADMIRVIGSRLTGDSLRRLWDRFGELQKSAVSEVLHGPEPEFSPEQFKAKYGALPADLGSEAPRGTVPLRLFLYPEDRYVSRPRIIPADLAERLRAFVPPPAEATLAAGDELPEAVERRRQRYVPEGEKPTFDRVRARASRHGTLGAAGPVHRDAPRRPGPGRGERHHAATLGRRDAAHRRSSGRRRLLRSGHEEGEALGAGDRSHQGVRLADAAAGREAGRTQWLEARAHEGGPCRPRQAAGGDVAPPLGAMAPEHPARRVQPRRRHQGAAARQRAGAR